MTQKSNIFKKRKAWWLNPWIIGVTAVFILIAVPLVLWIATYQSIAAVVMFVVTYITLLFFTLFLVKQSMLEPDLSVDEKEIDKRREEILIHRQQVTSEFLRNELDALRRGERTPVLDIWRLNPQLLKRHPYFQNLDAVVLDPQKEELYIRIQIGGILGHGAPPESVEISRLTPLASFLKILATDVNLQQLKQFFQFLIIELYTFREDRNHRKAAYPVFSLLLPATAIPQIPYTSIRDIKHFKILGDVRFQNGGEIIPHRGIESLRTDEL